MLNLQLERSPLILCCPRPRIVPIIARERRLGGIDGNLERLFDYRLVLPPVIFRPGAEYVDKILRYGAALRKDHVDVLVRCVGRVVEFAGVGSVWIIGRDWGFSDGGRFQFSNGNRGRCDGSGAYGRLRGSSSGGSGLPLGHRRDCGCC